MAPPKPELGSPRALTIDELKAEYDRLSKLQTQAETRRDLAQKNLEDLRAEARKNYQTDNVDELRQKLADMTKENEQKRADYQAALAKIAGDLSKVESDFAAAEAPAASVRTGG